MADTNDQVMVERFIAAPPATIFSLIADPSRHRDIDGSGSVREAKGPSQKLTLGSRFGMSMRIGVPYSMENTVVAFEEDRVLAWKTTGPGWLGRKVGGRIWRYDLEPEDGGTRVRETWDISDEAPLIRSFIRRQGGKTRTAMAATLDRIAGIVET